MEDTPASTASAAPAASARQHKQQAGSGQQQHPMSPRARTRENNRVVFRARGLIGKTTRIGKTTPASATILPGIAMLQHRVVAYGRHRGCFNRIDLGRLERRPVALDDPTGAPVSRREPRKSPETTTRTKIHKIQNHYKKRNERNREKRKQRDPARTVVDTKATTATRIQQKEYNKSNYSNYRTRSDIGSVLYSPCCGSARGTAPGTKTTDGTAVSRQEPKATRKRGVGSEREARAQREQSGRVKRARSRQETGETG